MTIESGLGATFTVDDSVPTARIITADVGDVNYDVSRADLQIPGVGTSAAVRLQGLADCSVTGNGYFNDASGASSFDVFKNAGSTSVIRTTAYVLSSQTFSIEGLIQSVSWQRVRDGGMNFAFAIALADGTAPAWS